MVDAVFVANGAYGALLNHTSRIWDHVAPHIVIEEAGGRYTQFSGAAMDYSNPTGRVDVNHSCCAATPGVHAELQELFSRHRQS
jgi:myo-inositol-1(or 4)-monophosphatase